MEQFDEIEEKAIEETRKKKPKMKISGKSVFLLQKKSIEPRKKKNACIKKVSKETRRF